MKLKFPLITGACIAAVAFCAPSTAPGKEKKSPTPGASAAASPAASGSPMEKSNRPIPYHGKVASVDATAKTFTVGTRTIKVTDQTKITKEGAAATMADIVVDEEVRGSYWKKEDGSLEAKTVKLGPKGEKSGASSSATPSASP
jgi:hypothetical protein